MLRSVAKSASVLLLQEVHGSSQEVRRLLHPLAADFHILLSVGKDRNTGGLATLVRKTAAPRFEDISNHIIMAGRVMITHISYRGNNSYYWNIHNYGIDAETRTTILSRLSNGIRISKAYPMNHTVWVGGDLNFLAPGDIKYSLLDPGRARDRHESRDDLRAPRQWTAVLSEMVEIQSLQPTHFCGANLLHALPS